MIEPTAYGTATEHTSRRNTHAMAQQVMLQSVPKHTTMSGNATEHT